MKILKVMLDFISGPLWKDVFDTQKKELVTGIEVVNNDEYLQKLNEEIQALYSFYYKINYNNEPFYFDKNKKDLIKKKC